jgi:hypothetical protein
VGREIQVSGLPMGHAVPMIGDRPKLAESLGKRVERFFPKNALDRIVGQA